MKGLKVSKLSPDRQSGMVLVTSLLLLVVVTVLAVSMFRSFGVDEKIAGNVREKQRALNAAETAEEFAESWLSLGNGTGAVTCTGMVASTVGQVCINTLSSLGLNPAVLPWTLSSGSQVGVNYTPGGQGGVALMTTSTAGGAGNYYANPVFFVGWLGTSTVNRITTTFYQIDAVGYGGSADTAAVVEATYSTTSSVSCLSCS